VAVFPQGLTNIDRRCNPGERRVLQQLKRCLGDDHLVWHNVPIGPRARQPDFVVLSPRQGVLLLEVKDWKRATLLEATRDRVELATERGPVTEANPLRQARDYAMELVDHMQRDPLLVHGEGAFRGKLIFPYGWGVVFSALRAQDVEPAQFHALFPRHQCLLRDDLEETVAPGEFGERLWGMFTVSYPHTLSLPQRDRIRWHLFPELRMPTQAALALDDDGVCLPTLPDLLQVMDLQQEQIARTLGEGHRVIHGVAGSGKTMILIHRAQHLAAAARPDRPVLVLCFNRSLADRIDALLRARGVDERVQVRTFHGWCKDVVDSYQLDVPREGGQDAYFQRMVACVDKALQTGFVPSGQYCALLVDEAHDFEDAWLRMAVRLVDPATNSLLVLYDDAQSIYQKRRKKFTMASVGVQAQGRTSVLKLNYRNTAEVLSLAVQCAQSLLQGGSEEIDDEGHIPLVQPASAGRRGELPVLMEAGSAREEAELVAEQVAGWVNAGTSPSDIAVLARTKYLLGPLEQALMRRKLPLQAMSSRSVRSFDWQAPAVRLLTLHSAKGLEFAAVHVAGLQALPLKDESLQEAARLLYVGMTRATRTLALSCAGDSPVVHQVRGALQSVRRTWGA
jgi:Nuclease-related domain/UvrD-like helicase C-terminal domain/AAA domain